MAKILPPGRPRSTPPSGVAAVVLGLFACLLACSQTFAETSASADVAKPVRAANWRTETHPDVAAFNAWAQALADPVTAGRPDASATARGVALARGRLAALKEWMRSDPARALAAGVPATVRAKLPAAVLDELETLFSATGDYTVQCELRPAGGPGVSTERRFITVGGRQYTAHVYGRRVGMTTKTGVFLHGVLLGDEAVLDENVLRVLPPDELALETRAARDLGTVTAGSPVAEGGVRLYRFDSGKSLRRAEAGLRALEDRRTAETAGLTEQAALEAPAGIPPDTDSVNSTGDKKVLVIRVDFSDLTGNNITPTNVDTVGNSQVAPYYARSSYGLTSLTFTASTKIYRLSRTASDYAVSGDNSGLHSDARTAASADYNLAGFDRVCVCFSSLGSISGSKITYGGLGDVGGSKVWVNGSFSFRILSHELGHTYGLQHGNLWQVTDGNPVSAAGTSVEYADEYETMGDNYTYDQKADFNAWYKNILGWLPDSQVQTVTRDGKYRVFRSDSDAHSGILALRIPRDSMRNYWVSVRRNFTSNPSMTHGVYVIWGYNANSTKETLLDMQTPGNSVLDAGLATGTTFNDPTGQVSISAVAEGGVSPGEYEDVQIKFIPTAAPVINSALNAAGQPAQPFSYQLTALNHPTIFGASGLPPGLSIDAASGLISGTVNAQGTYPVTLQATNGIGTGTAVLNLAFTSYNDSFSSAVVLSGASGRITANSAAATVEPGEPDPEQSGGRHSLWYAWTPTASGQVTFDTTGSSFDTVLAVFTGPGLSALTRVASNDDDGNNATSRVAFAAQAGVTYRVSVNGYGGAAGDVVLNWSQATAHPSFFGGEVALSDGVYYLAFPNGKIFGYYKFLSDPRFFYHFDMGFEYWFDAADGTGGIYLYDFTSNTFFYTSPTFGFPYLYDFSLRAFVYYYPDPTNPQRYNTKGVRYFYNFNTGQIISK